MQDTLRFHGLPKSTTQVMESFIIIIVVVVAAARVVVFVVVVETGGGGRVWILLHFLSRELAFERREQ
jgi:hypothetical protein